MYINGFFKIIRLNAWSGRFRRTHFTCRLWQYMH
jgi:hypothetical protein